MEVSAKIGDNIHNLFQTIASILPGNENNRAFMTDQSKKRNVYLFDVNIDFPMISSPNVQNINLTNRDPGEEEEFQKKKNCSC